MNQSPGQNTKEPKFNWFWPSITDTESAAKASREGVWVCVIIAAVNALVIVFTQVTGRSILGVDLWSLIDVCIYLSIAWLIQFRLNRAAALFGMLFFMLTNLALRIENLQTSGIMISLTLTLGLLNSVRGTFAYHRFRAAEAQQQDESVKSPNRRRVGIGAAILVAIGFAGLVVLGTLAPPEGVVTWEEISPRNQQILVESGLGVDEDSVVFLYSTGLTDILENLYVLTHQAVIIHETVDRERQHWEIPLETILTIRVAYSDRWNEASGLVVEDVDYLYVVPLSTHEGRDRAFVSKLEELTGLTASVIEVDESE